MKHLTFTFRLSENEQESLITLAKYLKRTKSDTIRLLIGNANEKLSHNDTQSYLQNPTREEQNAH
jgi:hypothetical protein